MLRCVAVLIHLLACGPSPAPEMAPESTSTRDTDGPASSQIDWVPLQQGLMIEDRQLEQSLVSVRVGEVRGLVFIDTGAASSFLAQTFVEATGLPAQLREVTVTDGQSSRAQAVALLENIPLEVAPLGRVTLPKAVGLPLPPPMIAAGIVGGINPQSLADASTAVVMDFAGHRIARVPVATARAMLTGTRLDDESTRACRYEESGIDAFIYTTEIEIGGERVRFQIDTGAGTSRFNYSHPVGRSLYESTTEEVLSRGVVGQVVDHLARDVPVTVGAGEFVIEELSVSVADAPEQPCPFHGLLGMDVLINCLLVLETEDISIACR